jgi:hypothetical protein
VNPNHPGNLANHQTGLTTVQGNQTTYQFDSDLVMYDLYKWTTNAPKQKSIPSVDCSYLCPLADPLFSFRTPLAMFQHLDAA